MKVENVLIKKKGEKTSHEKFWGKKAPCANNLRIPLEIGIVSNLKNKRAKLENRGERMIFMGCAEDHSGDMFRFWNPKTRRIIISRDVRWTNLIVNHTKPVNNRRLVMKSLSTIEEEEEETTKDESDAESISEETDSDEDHPQETTKDESDAESISDETDSEDHSQSPCDVIHHWCKRILIVYSRNTSCMTQSYQSGTKCAIIFFFKHPFCSKQPLSRWNFTQFNWSPHLSFFHGSELETDSEDHSQETTKDEDTTQAHAPVADFDDEKEDEASDQMNLEGSDNEESKNSDFDDFW